MTDDRHPLQDEIDDMLELEMFLKGEMPVDEWPEYLQHLLEEQHPYIAIPNVSRAIIHCLENGMVRAVVARGSHITPVVTQ